VDSECYRDSVVFGWSGCILSYISGIVGEYTGARVAH